MAINSDVCQHMFPESVSTHKYWRKLSGVSDYKWIPMELTDFTAVAVRSRYIVVLMKVIENLDFHCKYCIINKYTFVKVDSFIIKNIPSELIGNFVEIDEKIKVSKM